MKRHADTGSDFTGSTLETLIGQLSSIPLDKFAVVAWEGYRLIEPWDAASCEHPVVNECIAALKEQCSNYVVALDSSVNILDAGHTICSEAEELCKGFLSQEYSDEELLEFVTEMKVMAKQACSDGTRACEMFREVRRGLIRIQESMKENAGAIENEREEAMGLLQLAFKKRKRAQNAVKVSRLIILPAALPIFDSLFEKLEGRITRGSRFEINRREKQQVTCDQGLETLEAAAVYVDQLTKQVNTIIAWWLNMTTVLSGIEKSVGVLRNAGKVRMRVIANNWKECKEGYLGAKVQLCQFQDYYPPRSMPVQTTIEW